MVVQIFTTALLSSILHFTDTASEFSVRVLIVHGKYIPEQHWPEFDGIDIVRLLFGRK
jgi:hypothetical protein